MIDKKEQKINAVVYTTISFPNKVPEETAYAIACDVENVMFQSVDVINGHYRKKYGFTYDVLQVGMPALDEYMDKKEIECTTFH